MRTYGVAGPVVVGIDRSPESADAARYAADAAVAHCPLVVVPPDLLSPTGAHRALDTRVPVS